MYRFNSLLYTIYKLVPCFDVIVSNYNILTRIFNSPFFFFVVCDSYFWEYLKAKVCTHKPTIVEELKAAIREEMAAILFK